MTMNRLFALTLALFCTGLTLSLSANSVIPVVAPTGDEEEEGVIEMPLFYIDAAPAPGYLPTNAVAATRLGTANLGVTVGGAQDIRYFRDQVELGNIPHPTTFTMEGLLSEHDLPMPVEASGDALIYVGGQAIPAEILTDPNTRYLAQLGFGSGINAEKFQRLPLHLVAVVDKSGSMSGQPLDLVRLSLHSVVEQLGPQDQLSIVLYGDRSHVYLEPTPITSSNKKRLRDAIDAIESSGSTYLEAGLRTAYELARDTEFDGQTRLMLFTDERPNVGNTSAEAFMALAEKGAEQGYGLTTVGVGVQFGAELAEKISTVRGGNLFFFGNEDEMRKLFDEEFDTIVTELAYDFELTITPARGLELTGIYGIPGEALEWLDDERSVRMEVATLFASKNQGGIYFGFGPTETNLPNAYEEGSPVATANVAYVETFTGKPQSHEATFIVTDPENAAPGLERGYYLVNQYLAMLHASRAHYFDNDQETAWRHIHEFASLLSHSTDPALDPERQLIGNLESTLALLSGHRGEPSSLLGQLNRDHHSPLTGVWRVLAIDGKRAPELPGIGYQLAFLPAGGVLVVDEEGRGQKTYEAVTSDDTVTLTYPDGDTAEVMTFQLQNGQLELLDSSDTRFVLEPAKFVLAKADTPPDPVTGLPTRR